MDERLWTFSVYSRRCSARSNILPVDTRKGSMMLGFKRLLGEVYVLRLEQVVTTNTRTWQWGMLGKRASIVEPIVTICVGLYRSSNLNGGERLNGKSTFDVLQSATVLEKRSNGKRLAGVGTCLALSSISSKSL